MEERGEKYVTPAKSEQKCHLRPISEILTIYIYMHIHINTCIYIYERHVKQLSFPQWRIYVQQIPPFSPGENTKNRVMP